MCKEFDILISTCTMGCVNPATHPTWAADVKRCQGGLRRMSSARTETWRLAGSRCLPGENFGWRLWMPKVFTASNQFSAMFVSVAKKSAVGRPSVDIDRRAKGVKFRPVRASAAGRTGFPGIDSLLFHSRMVARFSDRGHLARNRAGETPTVRVGQESGRRTPMVCQTVRSRNRCRSGYNRTRQC